ncbi:MAG: hypothetical protein JNK89_10125 [Saprospiraceae bacterium]|nr:hypothetical protein [Saprospiraceae bacterium]
MISVSGHGWIALLLCFACIFFGKVTDSLQVWVLANLIAGIAIYFWGKQENRGHLIPPHSLAGTGMENFGLIMVVCAGVVQLIFL